MTDSSVSTPTEVYGYTVDGGGGGSNGSYVGSPQLLRGKYCLSLVVTVIDITELWCNSMK